MPRHEFDKDPERKIEEHEEESDEGTRHEHHVVREERFGPEEISEPEVVRYEGVQPVSGSAFSGADREEILDTREDSWNFAVRVLHTVALWVGVWLVVTEVLLALRLFFGLSAANAAAGFVAFVYGSTGWMVAPFQGIGPNAAVGAGVFEPAALAAILIYPLIALVIIVVLRAIAASPKPDQSHYRRASRRRTL